MFKGRGQLLNQSHDRSCCMLLHSDVLEMALTDLKILRIDYSHHKFDYLEKAGTLG